jgi:hypothetical protein
MKESLSADCGKGGRFEQGEVKGVGEEETHSIILVIVIAVLILFRLIIVIFLVICQALRAMP